MRVGFQRDIPFGRMGDVAVERNLRQRGVLTRQEGLMRQVGIDNREQLMGIGNQRFRVERGINQRPEP